MLAEKICQFFNQFCLWDEALFKLINMDGRTARMDFLMPLLSRRLLWVAIFFLIILFLLLNTRKDELKNLVIKIFFILACVGVTDIATTIAKETVGRTRPNSVIEGSWNHAPDTGWEQKHNLTPTGKRGASFFSAHAANSMTFAIITILLLPRLTVFVFWIPFVIGYARIYMGRHYPSDVVFGWFAGIVISFLLYKVYKKIIVKTEMGSRTVNRVQGIL